MEVMARYGDGACWYGGDADVALKMGRIMLRYRPIAPKPATGGMLTSAPLDAKSKSRRGKRKSPNTTVRRRRGRKPTKKLVTAGAFSKDKSSGSSSSSSVVTLPLMPVTPERREVSPAGSAESEGDASVSYLKQKMGTATAVAANAGDEVAVVVMVDCLTDTWRGLGIPTGLVDDTCPVFLSDAYERVTWANEAYRRMVAGSTSTEVALVTRGLVPAPLEGVTCFTCRVRVRYTCRRRGKVSMAAPCDVWRLADGRLVWRLDVNAALSLSVGT